MMWEEISKFSWHKPVILYCYQLWVAHLHGEPSEVEISAGLESHAATDEKTMQEAVRWRATISKVKYVEGGDSGGNYRLLIY